MVVDFVLIGPRPWNAFWGNVQRTFNTHAFQDYIVEADIKTDLVPKIPLRSGYLQDTLFKQIHVTRNMGTTTGTGAGGFSLEIAPLYPAGRPSIFSAQKIVAHSPPDKGYGQIYTVQDPFVHPKLIKTTGFRRNKAGVYWSSGRSAIYELNDPIAERDVLANVTRTISKHLLLEMERLFQNYKTVIWNVDIGAV